MTNLPCFQLHWHYYRHIEDIGKGFKKDRDNCNEAQSCNPGHNRKGWVLHGKVLELWGHSQPFDGIHDAIQIPHCGCMFSKFPETLLQLRGRVTDLYICNQQPGGPKPARTEIWFTINSSGYYRGQWDLLSHHNIIEAGTQPHRRHSVLVNWTCLVCPSLGEGLSCHYLPWVVVVQKGNTGWWLNQWLCRFCILRLSMVYMGSIGGTLKEAFRAKRLFNEA